MCPRRCAVAVGSVPRHEERQRKGQLSTGGCRLLVSFSLCSVHAPHMSCVRQFRTLETKIRTDGRSAGLLESRIKYRLKVRYSNVSWRTDMQVGVQRSARVIGHQNLHLTFRQILDVLVESAGFRGLDINRPTGLLISFEPEELPPLHRQIAPRDLMFRRGPQKIARCFLVTSSQRHSCVWGGGNILFEPTAYLHELGEALH